MNQQETQQVPKEMELNFPSLHPALVRTLKEGVIFHPLLVAPFGEYCNDSRIIRALNDGYLAKENLRMEFLREKRFEDYLFLIERKFRLDAFCDDLLPLLGDEQYWQLLGNIWVDCECPYINFPIWRSLFASNRPCRESLMDKEERKRFSALPDMLTLYRGGRNAKGLSWTLDEDKARWFAGIYRYPSKKNKVFKGAVEKKDIYAFLNGRDELEILVDPKEVALTKY